jgi:hypothetical protein
MRNYFLLLLFFTCVKAYATPGGEVTTRHPSGLPASITALGHEVIVSDSKGETCDAPIVMRQADDQPSRIRAQYVWLDSVYPNYTLVKRATRYNEAADSPIVDLEKIRIYSWFSLKNEASGDFEVCFDITEASLPRLKTIMEAQTKSRQP